MTLPTAVAKESQLSNPDALIVLYQLDMSIVGGGIQYFTSDSVGTSGSIYFGGLEYTPVDIEAEGFEWNGKGPMPAPTLRISNAFNMASGLAQNYNDLLGCTLYRVRTHRMFLDDGSDPDSSATYPIDVYTVERKVNQNKVFMEWELSAAIDQQGRMIPGRQVLKDTCTHIYRRWTGSVFDYTKATCPYVGDTYYDAIGNPTTESADKCGKRLSDCRLRFGENGKLPTRAFPGVLSIRAQ